MIREIAELVELNKSNMQDIKAKTDNDGSPLLYNQTGSLRSTYDRFDSESYRAAHKPRLTARHRKSRLRWTKEHLNWTGDQWRNVVWSDELRSCMEGSKRGKRILRKEGNRYDERSIVSTVKWGGDGAMA
ncbi:hypothetical protein G6F43_003872 [Rhizopus delemar]|nr:hypothetical protein G6F43_003872 [Rhizopus delemar]